MRPGLGGGGRGCYDDGVVSRSFWVLAALVLIVGCGSSEDSEGALEELERPVAPRDRALVEVVVRRVPAVALVSK